MADRGLQGEHLRPPDAGRLTPFLAWLAAWRAVPESSPVLLGCERVLERAWRAGYLTRVDTVAGPAYGLSLEGERLVGRLAAVRRMSLDGLNRRVLLHLAAAQHGMPVVGFSRNGIAVEAKDRVLVLGWGSGDLKAGPVGSGADFEVSLPKQVDFGELSLPDAAWVAVAGAVLPPPTVPMRGRYWTRTLLEAALALRAGKTPAELGLSDRLLRATRWFVRSRAVWERLDSLLARR